MNGTTPETNTQTPNPAPAQAPAAPANLDPEAIKAEVLREVFGDKNFKSVEEARQGFWNLTNYASQAYELLNQRVDPAATAQARTATALERLKNEAMVPPDAFTDAVRTIAGTLVQESLAPIQQAVAARQALVTQVPDYIRHEPDINGWLSTNPEVSREVQRLTNAGLYDVAAKTALREWRAANPPANAGNPAAKAQAALPNQTSNGNPQVDPQQDPNMLAQAIRYAHITGDRRAAYSGVFPDFKVQLPAHLADQLQRG